MSHTPTRTTATRTTTTIKEFRAGRKLLIYYSTVELQGAVTYFCIHGAMAHHGQFLELVNGLKKGPACNVVAYDALGCGGSAIVLPNATDPTPYSTESLQRDAMDVYNAYLISCKKVVLIGHSYGSAVVARLVNSLPTPTNITALVLISTVRDFPAGVFAIFDYPVWLLQCLQGRMSRNFVSVAFSPKTDSETKARCLAASNLNSMAVCKSFYQSFEWPTALEWAAVGAAQPPVPVLIVQGEDDVITPVSGAKALFDDYLSSPSSPSSLSSFFATIPEAGHQIIQEKPMETAASILAFLEGIIGDK